MSVLLDGLTLFSEVIPSGATRYVPVPIRDGKLGALIAWKDATSSATITLELTSYDGLAPTVAGAAWEWVGSGVTITGPTAAAAAGSLVNVENIRQRSARLKIVTAAISTIEIKDGTAP